MLMLQVGTGESIQKKKLVNEMSLIYAKEDLDENRSIDDVDYVNEGNSRKNKHHMILEHRDSNAIMMTKN